MAQLGVSDSDVASALHLSRAVTVKKLNNILLLNLDEAEKLADLLRISDEAFGGYFFA